MSKFKLSAIVTKSGRVLATGRNKTYSNFITGLKKYSKELWSMNRCAEKDAIERILKHQDGIKHLAGATIYVTRYGKAGETRLAKPCSHCMELIESVGIKRIIYTKVGGTEEIRL